MTRRGGDQDLTNLNSVNFDFLSIQTFKTLDKEKYVRTR